MTDRRTDSATAGCYPCSDCHALRHELDNYKAIVQTAVELRRELEYQLDASRQTIDALARSLADARDSRTATLARQALAHLQDVLGTLSKEADGIEGQRKRNAARAFLVNEGVRAPECEAYAEAYERWEAARAR